MLKPEPTISLPVVEPTRLSIRRSKNAPRRAAVLILIHVVILAHLAHWWTTGRTLTPVEPSEAMRTLEQGEVNAGAIFFAFAILSTLLLGRLFCGWGCHVVALQDLCAWLMKKLGVRPKPFRSRLLVFMPLVFALYMFVWPLLKRVAIAPIFEPIWPTIRTDLRIGALPPTGFSNHLQTTEFWSTFPGVLVAISFLLICGFACVYFLGSKGFCTYGCPYGGIFGVADQISIGRIVVDHDKCAHCGHCTATCTSNVRVHEEIDRFGMVVDPGCMKCMDCISVCPNGALSLKLARPSLLKRSRKTSPRRRLYDTTRAEDLALIMVFLASFLAVRGAYDLIPLLMALGIAACATYLAWKLWRLVRDDSVRLASFQLKYKGVLKLPGVLFAIVTVAGAALMVHTGAVNAFDARAETLHRRITIPLESLLASPTTEIDAQIQRDASGALAASARAAKLGFFEPVGAVARRAYLHLALGERDAAEALLRALYSRDRMTDALVADFCQLLASDPSRIDDALGILQYELRDHPEYWRTREQHALILIPLGRATHVIDLAHSARAELEGDVLHRRAQARTRLTLARALSATNRTDDALAQLELAAQEAPGDATIRENLAAALYQVRGDIAGAIAQLRAAIRANPFDADLHFQLGRLLLERGDTNAARGPFDHAIELDPSPERRAMIDALFAR